LDNTAQAIKAVDTMEQSIVPSAQETLPLLLAQADTGNSGTCVGCGAEGGVNAVDMISTNLLSTAQGVFVEYTS